MEVGKTYRANIQIDLKKAIFYLDGKKYYSCILEKGDVEKHGRIGFTTWSGKGNSTIFHYRVVSGEVSKKK